MALNKQGQLLIKSYAVRNAAKPAATVALVGVPRRYLEYVSPSKELTRLFKKIAYPSERS
jgi:hypothetical protein